MSILADFVIEFLDLKPSGVVRLSLGLHVLKDIMVLGCLLITIVFCHIPGLEYLLPLLGAFVATFHAAWSYTIYAHHGLDGSKKLPITFYLKDGFTTLPIYGLGLTSLILTPIPWLGGVLLGNATFLLFSSYVLTFVSERFRISAINYAARYADSDSSSLDSSTAPTQTNQPDEPFELTTSPTFAEYYRNATDTDSDTTSSSQDPEQPRRFCCFTC